ncbi:conserved hypothetical protein [Aspergillus lentulus]|nr:conserved hypothetical protein [Aspergillus lentulus]
MFIQRLKTISYKKWWLELAWEEIEKEFGLRFAKKTMRSLQMRWSRKLKLTAPSTRCSKRKRSSR